MSCVSLNRPKPLMRGAIVLAAIVVAPATGQVPAYVPTDLGTVGGPEIRTFPGSFAFAANEQGLVVGHSIADDETGALRGFTWDGAMVALDTLPGDDHAVAMGINGSGQIVGSSFVLGELTVDAARWTGTVPMDLGTFEPLGINDAGMIVGRRSIPPTHVHTTAVMFTGAALLDLGTLGGPTSVAHAINGAGWIAGSSFVDDLATHAFLWNGTMHDLGTLGGTSSQALSLNDSNQIVGFSDTASGARHAAIFEVDPQGDIVNAIDLGELGGGHSVAYDVNDDGMVVGTSDGRAFLWSFGVMEDLNELVNPSLGWRLTHATAITAGGTIVGHGWHDGLPRAFRLDPRATADLDANGAVDFVDLLILLAAWGPCPAPPASCPTDLDGDGVTGFVDLLVVLSGWTV